MHEQNELLVVQTASMFACPMVQVTLYKNKKKSRDGYPGCTQQDSG